MSAKKPGLTLDEHKALAAQLYDMRNQLLTLMVETSHKYPKNSPLVKYLTAAGDQLDKARSKGDDFLAVEYPNDFDPGIYYPGANRGRQG
jgi:hypothetical protein